MIESTTARAPFARRPAIISPWTDLVCVGGGSILVFLPLVLAGNDLILKASPAMLAWLATLINLPHFLASYRLVYSSRETVLRYKAASLYVPGALIAYSVFAVYMSNESFACVNFMVGISGVYLAWHYTGQTWGMMATYSILDGNPFSKHERLLCRTALYLLLVWHVSWFCLYGTDSAWIQENLGVTYMFMPYVMGVAVALGLAGFAVQYRRVRQWPPLRVVIPWTAIFFWYGALARNSSSAHSYAASALMWVQLAHAIQYLIFPIRVEMNRDLRTHNSNEKHALRHVLIYTTVLVAGAVALQEAFVPATQLSARALFGNAAGDAVPMVMLAFLNIHHYFTDGCIWKISNPAVRADLFGHLPGPAA